VNPDRFEETLRRQPLRPVPPDWREAVLSAARAGAGEPEPAAPPAGWRSWLWPAPTAWGALAAAWILIAALRAADRGAGASAPSPTPAAAARTSQAFVEYQRVRAELLGGPS